jgi:hypothetical protein
MFKKKIDYFTLTPLILLIWGIISVIYIPTLPVANGFGWDGIEYAKIVLHWDTLVGHLDKYRAGRIIPSIFIHYGLKLLSIPISLKSAFIGFQIYTIFIIFCSGLFWIKIVKNASFSNYTKWVGFCALFLNYPLITFIIIIPV